MNQIGYITDNMYLKMIINIKLKKLPVHIPFSCLQFLW